MEIIDLSHIINSRIPAYPGTEPPRFTNRCTIERDGFLEREIQLYSHTGTHLDAPAHILTDGQTLDQIPPDGFFGKACIVDLRHLTEPTIEIDEIKPYGNVIGRSDFVLLNTGWSKWWGKREYYEGFPVLSYDASRWLSGFQLKGLGVDTISVDEMTSVDFSVHRIFLGRGILVIENLTNLDRVKWDDFFFSCLPIMIEKGDGSPIRAVAINKVF